MRASFAFYNSIYKMHHDIIVFLYSSTDPFGVLRGLSMILQYVLRAEDPIMRICNIAKRAIKNQQRYRYLPLILTKQDGEDFLHIELNSLFNLDSVNTR